MSTHYHPTWTPAEIAAIDELALLKDLLPVTIIRQALRAYQLTHAPLLTAANPVSEVNPVTPLPLPVRACLHQDMTPPRIKIESKDTVVIDRLVNDAHADDIVRRLNHHDALVNALQRIQSLGHGPDQGSAGWQAETAHTIATQALSHL